MFEVSDEQGNRFFVESKDLACKIVNERSNPFINIVELDDRIQVSKRHIVKSYEHFLEYFYQVMPIENDFSKKCKELKKVIIASYDWTGESSFDERLEENLSKNPSLKRFYDENFRNI